MSFLAVIPARGGSKGLKRKNLKKIEGRSLTARAVMIAKAIPEIEFILLSTDCREIAREGLSYGAQVPFLRPAALSRGDTPMVAVLEHAVAWFREAMPSGAESCEGLVLLQPTSPMRSIEHVRNAIRMFLRFQNDGNPVDCIHCVSPVPETFQPDKLFRMTGDGILQSSTQCDPVGRTVYRNGAAVVLDMDHIDALTVSGRTAGLVIEDQLVSIDSHYDLKRAESMMSETNPVENALIHG